MPDDTRTIFRGDALRHFVEGREPSVLPHFIRPRTFLCLWILLGLIIVSLVMTWAMRVPSYVAGISLVAEADGKTMLFVLVPTEFSEKLAVGQTVWVRRPASRVVTRTRIIHVEPMPQSPVVARLRFGLSSETIQVPVVVATANVEEELQTAREPLLESYLGSTAPVDVEVGSRRVLSLLSGFSEIIP